MEHELQIFDLHCDTLDRLAWPLLDADINGGDYVHLPADKEWIESGKLTSFVGAKSHLSLEQMAPLGWAQCVAVFVPDGLTPEQSARFFRTVSSTLALHQEAHQDLLARVQNAHDIEPVIRKGKVAAVLTIEGGTLLAASDDMLDEIEAAGVKMLTLTWNGANPLGSGNETQQGLTSFGERMVGELEARKIIVDVSHLNDAGFADVERIAKRPFVASHSNARAVCDHPRNLTDDQFRAIRDAGGIVGLNFYNMFLTSENAEATPQDMLAHVEHWLDLDGADTVALGSDYDGCDVPEWLNPCSKMVDLIQLFELHFGAELAAKILHENALHFFSEMID